MTLLFQTIKYFMLSISDKVEKQKLKIKENQKIKILKNRN